MTDWPPLTAADTASRHFPLPPSRICSGAARQASWPAKRPLTSWPVMARFSPALPPGLDMTPATADVLACRSSSLRCCPGKRATRGLGGHRSAYVEGQPRSSRRAGCCAVSWSGWRSWATASAHGGGGGVPSCCSPAVEAIADGRDSQRKPCLRPNLALMRQFELTAACSKRWRSWAGGPCTGRSRGCQRPVRDQLDLRQSLVTPTATPLSRVWRRRWPSPCGLAGEGSRQALPQLTGSGAHPATLALGHIRRPQPSFTTPAVRLGSRHWRTTFCPRAGACAGPVRHHHPTAESYCAARGPDRPSPAPPGRPAGSVMRNTAATWAHPDDQRLELRLADSAAKPLTCCAAVLAAGLDGLSGSLDPGPATTPTSQPTRPAPVDSAPALPDPEEALPPFAADTVLRQALGDPSCSGYESLRRQHG